MVRDALVAQEAATILGNQHVIFDADATKVLIGLQFVEVEEFFAMAAGLPLVDEGRDEVDAWLVSNHEAFFQLTTHAQTVGTELLEVGARLIVETNVDLT